MGKLLAQRLHKPLAAIQNRGKAGRFEATATAGVVTGMWVWLIFAHSSLSYSPQTMPWVSWRVAAFGFKTSNIYRMPVARSCFSNSSRSDWLQLRPMGLTFSIPLRNSMKVPRLTGMSISALSLISVVLHFQLSPGDGSHEGYARLCRTR